MTRENLLVNNVPGHPQAWGFCGTLRGHCQLSCSAKQQLFQQAATEKPQVHNNMLTVEGPGTTDLLRDKACSEKRGGSRRILSENVWKIEIKYHILWHKNWNLCRVLIIHAFHELKASREYWRIGRTAAHTLAFLLGASVLFRFQTCVPCSERDSETREGKQHVRRIHHYLPKNSPFSLTGTEEFPALEEGDCFTCTGFCRLGSFSSLFLPTSQAKHWIPIVTPALLLFTELSMGTKVSHSTGSRLR